MDLKPMYGSELFLITVDYDKGFDGLKRDGKYGSRSFLFSHATAEHYGAGHLCGLALGVDEVGARSLEIVYQEDHLPWLPDSAFLAICD